MRRSPFVEVAKARLPSGFHLVAEAAPTRVVPREVNSRPPGAQGGPGLRQSRPGQARSPRGCRVPAVTQDGPAGAPGPRRKAERRGSTYSDTILSDSTSAA